MKEYLYIFIGGGAGSAMRYLLSKNWNLFYQIPVGTLLVNTLGSFLLGLVLGYVIKNQVAGPALLLLTVGFCGGFTTFSTFAAENFTFLKNGDYLHFLTYTFLSFSFSILGIYLGYLLIKSINI